MPLKLPSFRARRDVYPPDLWTKCPTCSTMLFNKQLEKNLRVCTTCGHHFRLSATRPPRAPPRPRDRGRSATPASSRSMRSASSTRSPTRTGSPPPSWRPACATPRCGAPAPIGGTPVAMCVMDFGFMGGSMGAVVGEKVTRAAEHALAARVPLVIVSASGGARMQEGTLALMQLAKTLAALERLRGRRRAVHVDPVRPDDRRRVRLVRRGRRRQHRRARRAHRLRRRAGHGRHDRGRAAAGLPARRVPVQPRVRRPGRRRAPTCATSSTAPAAAPARRAASPAPIVDADDGRPGVPAAVVPVDRSPTGSASWRRRRRAGRGSAAATRRRRAGAGPGRHRPRDADGVADDGAARRDAAATDAVWARVQLARNLRRPRTLEFVAAMADDFIELHGDRLFGDDAAMVAGLARIDGRRVVVIGQQKGADTDENIRRNFGMPHPGGLSQGDAGHGARRAVRPAGRHLRRRARAPTPARSRRSAASPRRSPARSG